MEYFLYKNLYMWWKFLYVFKIFSIIRLFKD